MWRPDLPQFHPNLMRRRRNSGQTVSSSSEFSSQTTLLTFIFLLDNMLSHVDGGREGARKGTGWASGDSLNLKVISKVLGRMRSAKWKEKGATD